MRKASERIKGALHALSNDVAEVASGELSVAAASVEGAIRERISGMVTTISERAAGKGSGQGASFQGVDQEKILTFIPDRRDLGGAGPILLAIFFFTVLPGTLGYMVSVGSLFAGIMLFYITYLRHSRVDVPDGYSGVVCNFGKPDEQRTAQPGRTWLPNFSSFAPYLVSLRDQVVKTSNANLTGDFASVVLGFQITFRITNPAVFTSNSSPVGIMKLIELYSSYIALRMITSIGDARVKFTGRDRLKNVVAELNRHLDSYGVTVVSATLPEGSNNTLDDLEQVRTLLKEVAAMTETRTVQLEGAVKSVEGNMRQQTRAARSAAIGLESQRISLETAVGEAVHGNRQSVLIGARRQLEEKATELMREIAGLRAKAALSAAIAGSIEGLDTDHKIRAAAIKRKLLARLVPKQVHVLGVEGMGSAAGLAALLDPFLRRALPPSSAANPSPESA